MEAKGKATKSLSWRRKVSDRARLKFLENMVGKRFGRLVCVGLKEVPIGEALIAVCDCDCGNRTLTKGANLRAGNTKSCGCLQDETRKTNQRTHGLTNSREYRIWTNMKTRCYNAANEAFADYGARGIVMCDAWRNDFQRFLADMGSCPMGMTIDRRDNAQGYSRENCYWATYQEQNNNRRSNRLITRNGITKTIAQWSREVGIGQVKLRTLIERGSF